ncbi:MAG: histidine phosphatase family protein, partial [Planctomycetota bacterium]
KSRAAQTAEILAGAVDVERGCSARDGLAPNDDVSTIADELEACDADLMIVGHLPFVGYLSSLLTAGKETAEIVAFDAGAIACLNRRDPGQWHVEWTIMPRFLT